MRWLGVFGLPLALACGCGGSESSPGGTGGAGAAGASAAGTGGASAGTSSSGGTSGASAGSAGSGTSGSAGSSSGGGGAGTKSDCSGTFGPPVLVLELQDQLIGSLSLGPGELELLFVTGPADALGPQTYRRSVRADTSQPFTAGEPVPQLDAACGDPTLVRSGDLSLDGLRYYFVCYPTDPLVETPLRLATRASLDAPFVVDSKTYGEVHAGPTLSPDELELLTSPAAYSSSPTLRYRRSSLTASFQLAMDEPTGVELRTPELSADGRFVFGSTLGGGAPMALQSAERTASGLFTNAVDLLTSQADVNALGSAAISGDCRSLYYVSVEANPATPGGWSQRVRVLRR